MSNIFDKMNFMPGASIEELKEEAIKHTKEIMETVNQIPNMTDTIFAAILAAGIRIAVFGDGEISDKEKSLVEAFCSEVFGDAALEIFWELIKHPVGEQSYKIVEDLFQMSNMTGMQFCNFIMCFAYVDGVFEQEVSQRLSDIVNKYTKTYKVKSCIPKSQRGSRARNADVHLDLIIKEKKPESPEEKAKRLAAEEARRKAEEEKKRAEEQARRKIEEERRKVEAAEREYWEPLKQYIAKKQKLFEDEKNAQKSYDRQIERILERGEYDTTRAERSLNYSLGNIAKEGEGLIEELLSLGEKCLGANVSVILVKEVGNTIKEVSNFMKRMGTLSKKEIFEKPNNYPRILEDDIAWWSNLSTKGESDIVKLVEQRSVELRKAMAEMQEWQVLSDKNGKCRETEITTAFAEIEEHLEAEKVRIQEEIETKRVSLEGEKEALQSKLSEHERELSSLGFFKFGRKKELNNLISQEKNGMSSLQDKISGLNQEMETTLRNAERKAAEDKSARQIQIEEKYPIPESPLSVYQKKQEEIKKQKQIELDKKIVAERKEKREKLMASLNTKEKTMIFEYIEKHPQALISQIMESSPELKNLSNQRISALIRQMVLDGYLSREERNYKAYFSVSEEYL